MRRIRHHTVACALGTASAFSAFSIRAEGPPEETAGIILVCNSTPIAAVARAERLRGAAEVSAAGILPNLALVATHDRSFNGPTDAETVVGLSVPVQVSGRRSLLKDAARARREQADAEAHATLFESALAFRDAYATAVVDRAKLDVATRQQAVLMRLSATIRGLENRGEAAGYDILRQETQARIQRGSIELLRARAASSRARLVAWTGSEVSLPAASLESLTGGPRPNTRGLPDASPRARSLSVAGRAADLEARAARRGAVPDAEIFAGYRATELEREIGHGISVGVTLPLTFFDHGQGEAARAQAEATLARARASVLRREQLAELGSAHAILDLLEPSIREAQQVVRDTAELRTRAERLYAAGEGSITELLEAFRSVEEAELALINVQEEIARARVSLMRARGSLLDPNLDRRCGAPAAGGVP